LPRQEQCCFRLLHTESWTFCIVTTAAIISALGHVGGCAASACNFRSCAASALSP
jgi:hypothetical protein